MNKDTIKEIVIELRDNQGKSFQDISDYIEQQYGIKKTRQSIHGLYNRAKNKVENNVDNDLMLDIVNLYVLGYNISTIQKLLYSVDNTITNYKITSVINDKSVMIDNIREAFINKVEEQIYNGNTYSNIRENLRYNENVITDNGYRDILKREMINEAKRRFGAGRYHVDSVGGTDVSSLILWGALFGHGFSLRPLKRKQAAFVEGHK